MGQSARHLGDLGQHSFVFVRLITESIYPFAFATSHGFIAMTALLPWLASRRRALPADGSHPLPRLWKTIGHILGTTNGRPTNVLAATAVSHVGSAVVAMLQAAVPLMVAGLARERRAWVRS
ncbi:MAG TPA: EamA family transporter [Casimicrobiaceae bacterium]|nr:EamA family transporter [Casimicrobiaceae bacterium]